VFSHFFSLELWEGEKKDTKQQNKNNKRNHEKGPRPCISIANGCVLSTFRSAVCRKEMSVVFI